jgi:hypothetical protein
MRFIGVLIGYLCMPLVMAALLLSPLLVVPALFVPGFTVFRKTSSRAVWNIASYHSPHSLTWSWGLSLRRQPTFTFRPWAQFHGGNFSGFGAGFGQLIAFSAYRNNGGWQIGWSLLWHELHRSRQQPMWFRDIYRRNVEEEDAQASARRSIIGIDAMVKEEYREGVSAGAAARQLCRSLSARSELKRMLEDMLGDANKSAHDRWRILDAFSRAAPDEADLARMASFRYMNNLPDPAAPMSDGEIGASVH